MIKEILKYLNPITKLMLIYIDNIFMTDIIQEISCNMIVDQLLNYRFDYKENYKIIEILNG